jgi:phosphoglycolate phosphatase
VNEELDAFDAVVYDLDGTLVRLLVDWDDVAREAARVFADADATVHGIDLWGMIDLAEEYGLRGEVEAVISEHERDGARASDRLPLADAVPGFDGPAGVCSLNCEDACRIALDTHDLSRYVDAVVGRDTVSTRKPDPKPLLATLDRLGVEPTDAVFVGDSPRDELTADRAGVAFRYVEGGPSDH